MKKFLLILIALTILVLGGCNSKENSNNTKQKTDTKKTESSTKKKSSKIIEPEELITKEDAEKLTGLKIVDVEKTEEERVGLKIYGYTTEGDVMDSILLQITISQQAFMVKGQPNTPEDIYRGTLDMFDDKIKVEGIGDEAYIFTPGLHILRDGYYITISAGKTSDPDVQELLKKAGKHAIDNLDKLK